MRKNFLSSILLAGCVSPCLAQTEITTADTKKVRTFEHHIGVQMNELIRQVFNFNNASSVVNPYLLNYNINQVKTGWGLRLGVGYSYNDGNNNDGITSSTSKINDVQTRLGVEKRFILSRKWTTGVGLDGTVKINDDKSSGTVHSFDTVTTTTKSAMKSYGGGAMGWLRYHVTDRIAIGTEASFYYSSGKQTNSTAITTVSRFGVITTTETKSNPTISQGNFNLPVTFYLTVKF
jgi:hypothetical protein